MEDFSKCFWSSQNIQTLNSTIGFGFNNWPKAQFYHSQMFCFGRLRKLQLRSLSACNSITDIAIIISQLAISETNGSSAQLAPRQSVQFSLKLCAKNWHIWDLRGLRKNFSYGLGQQTIIVYELFFAPLSMNSN